jgi:two-component system, NarL family, response regulator NreC
MAKSQRILIVDDNLALREGLKAILSNFAAFEIVGEAADGVEAVEAVEKLHPDLIFMDISMPRMDGIAATKEIKKKRPETKVLVFTIYNIPEYLAAAHEAGADGYLLKDSSQGEMIQSIEDILAGNQGFPQNFMELKG